MALGKSSQRENIGSVGMEERVYSVRVYVEGGSLMRSGKQRMCMGG
jgi:hypothetical protein